MEGYAGKKLILASQSPQRKELLEAAGYRFVVHAPSESAECGVCSGETPIEMVTRLAYQKAADVALHHENGVIIGCDTVAECHGQVLGKPRDEEDARRMLLMLSGNEHRVYSGLCLLITPEGEKHLSVATTRLRMDRLRDRELESYLAGGEWEGKAGAFGYQDRLGWVHVLEGSESNVVGLPMELLKEMLFNTSFRSEK